eukprot:m.164136 g.164136  ORF g.164136 m.164136 type:complete len:1092 (+) comp14397_c0_seq1:251-3526(+)
MSISQPAVHEEYIELARLDDEQRYLAHRDHHDETMAISTGIQRRTTSAKSFEKRRVAQVRIWSEERAFFAAKLDLVNVLKKFEQDSFGTYEERAAYYRTTKDPVGASVLHVAILCDSKQVAKYLINEYGKDIARLPYTATPESPYEGETALHLAIVKGHFDLVKLLVRTGVDINAVATGHFFDQDVGDKGIYFGSTPLHFAVCSHSLGVADYLLNHGADPTIQDRYGNTALHLAVWYEDEAMYDLVADRDQAFAGKLGGATNRLSMTPLKLAASRASKKMFRKILERSRELHWSFGPVEEYLYPLGDLDTFDTDSAIDLLVIYGTIEHAKLLVVPPVYDLLTEKWRKFGRFGFVLFLMAYLLVLSGIVAVLFMTPYDPKDYSQFGRKRWGVELMVVIMMFSETLQKIWALIRWIRHPLSSIRGYRVGSFIQTASGWLFRLNLLICVVLRFVNVPITTERGFLSSLGVLAWFYLLHFGRSIRQFSRFVLLLERMAVDLQQWVIVFSLVTVGVGLGFSFLYRDIDAEFAGTVAYDLRHLDKAIFTLAKWTMGEFEFRTDEAHAANSSVASYTIFFFFLIFVSVILFNILIAMMTSTFQVYLEQAELMAVLQWATTIVSMERLFRWFPIRSGIRGEECGARPNEWYKTVLVRNRGFHAASTVSGAAVGTTSGNAGGNAGDGVVSLTSAAQAQRQMQDAAAPAKRVPGYPSAFHEKNLQHWEHVLAHIHSDSRNGTYISCHAELHSIFRLFDVYRTRACNRETAAFILQDLVFNDALIPNERTKESVKTASLTVASVLDPDGDDSIPLETLSTFCRLSKISLDQRRSGNYRVDTALIIVDCQNDFKGTGVMPVANASGQSVFGTINHLRKNYDWDMVVFTQDYHPADHCSFLREDSQPAGCGDDVEVLITADGNQICLPDDVDDMRWPPHCIAGTPGSNIVDELLPIQQHEVVIQKGGDSNVDSYSAFWNNNRTKETSLYAKLFDANIERVVIVGLGYDCQVGRTAYDAAAYGFETFIAVDACRWFNDRWKVEMDLELQGANVQTVKSEALDSLISNLNPQLIDTDRIVSQATSARQSLRTRAPKTYSRLGPMAL